MNDLFYGLKILVLNDDPVSRTAFVRELEEIRFHNIIASAGLEAFMEEINTGEPVFPDMIFIDGQKTGCRSIEYVRELKKITHLKPVPVVLLCYTCTRDCIEKAFAVGVYDILGKPYSVNELFSRTVAALIYRQEILHREGHEAEIIQMQKALIDRNLEIEVLLDSMNRDILQADRIRERFFSVDRGLPPELKCRWIFEPSVPMGGTFFNTIHLETGEVVFYLFDSSCRGLVSLMFNVLLTREVLRLTRAEGKDQAFEVRDPLSMMEMIKQFVGLKENSDIYLSLIYGVISADRSSLHLISAGPSPLLIKAPDSETVTVSSLYPPIGWEEEVKHEARRYPLTPGTRIFFYSEAFGTLLSEGDTGEFGLFRMTCLLDSLAEKPFEKSFDKIENDSKFLRFEKKFNNDLFIMGIEV